MRTVWLLVAAILLVGVVGCGEPGPKMGDVRVNPKDGAKMVWVPEGEFTMGSTDEQAAAALEQWPEYSQEIGEFFLDVQKPQRKVYLVGYWMYKYEVTVAQYRKFCEATKKEMPKAPRWSWKDDHPIVNVSWQDAVDYAKWAGVSLPTEAQWEKAARGTDGRIYPWGNKWDASKCASSVETLLKGTQPVRSYTSGASPYGCMDMAGNVYEWCADWYDPNYYKNAPSRNPKGPSEAVKFTIPQVGDVPGARVLRGGSWFYLNFLCAYRDYFDPTYRYDFNGFRCARTP